MGMEVPKGVRRMVCSLTKSLPSWEAMKGETNSGWIERQHAAIRSQNPTVPLVARANLQVQAVHAESPTPRRFVTTRNVASHVAALENLSPRALEKRAVRRDNNDVDVDDNQFISAYPAPAHLPPRPQPPKYRRSFLETFLARQQNKEAAGTSKIAVSNNTSRLLNPINHLPRPTPVHFPLPERVHEAGATERRTLLALPEQRRSRQNSPNSPTFQDSFAPDLENSHRTSIGLPSNHRASAQSLDLTKQPSMSQEKPLPASPPVMEPPTRQNTQERTAAESSTQSKLASNYGVSEQDQPAHPPRRVDSQRSLHHVRSLTSLHSSTYAPTNSAAVPPLPTSSHSQVTSQATPIQSQPPTSHRDRDVERGPESNPEEPAWGPAHPCFPHLNPHVPLHSALYNSTRIIRIRRDWMIVGDLAPAYSNIYPEILDPLLPEQEFRYITQHINDTLIHAYDPFSVSNWVDGVLGFLTGWFWEDFRTGGVKGQLRKLEAWIEEWNRTVGASDGVKLISLRRTGYTCLDIQIPDPQVRVVDQDGGDGGSATPRPAASVIAGISGR